MLVAVNCVIAEFRTCVNSARQRRPALKSLVEFVADRSRHTSRQYLLRYRIAGGRINVLKDPDQI
jgi:hypothetical protein